MLFIRECYICIFPVFQLEILKSFYEDVTVLSHQISGNNNHIS